MTRSFLILDSEDGPGGAWRQAWVSLRLFSPANWNSLAGWLMPATAQGFPTRNEVIDVDTQSERRTGLSATALAHTSEQRLLRAHFSTFRPRQAMGDSRRFVDAQAPIYEAALSELSVGMKQTAATSLARRFADFR